MKVRENISDILFDRALRHGDRIAFQYIGRPSGTLGQLTFFELHERANALACLLRQRFPMGARAVLLFPQSLDFVVAFMACLRAGVVAIPLSLPINRQGQTRLLAVLEDSAPDVVLTLCATSETQECRLLAQLKPDLAWILTDQAPQDEVDLSGIDLPELQLQDIAFLQYTSGSTSLPKGVIVTHANIVANQKMIAHGFNLSEADIGLTWLPLYHDMGLIGFVIQPIFSGVTTYMMSPSDLLRKPLQWLAAIDKYKVTISGGPNFGYGFCNDRISDELAATLDLSSWRVAPNGAEPVQPHTLKAFSEKFSVAGFDERAHFPCYGLAEATLFVSGGPAFSACRHLEVDTEALELDQIRLKEGGRALVSSGLTAPGLVLQIVNPTTLAVCPPQTVGEVWVSGPNVAAGYWRNEPATQDTFGAQLAGDDRRYMRTGDLGFVTEQGELVITGRLKDLIIIGGKNYYPQDIEAIAEQSHPALRASASAVFVAEEGDDGVSVMVELRKDAMPCRRIDEIKAAVRCAISHDAALRVEHVVIVAPGQVLKTTSGKIRRRDCREQWLAGRIQAVPNVVPERAELEPVLAA